MLRARRLTALALLCALGVVAGCAAEAPVTATRTPAPSASPMPSPTAVDPAVQAVAEMTTAERAASVVMGHIPTTDAAALHDYMAAGYGGFILMGANIPATQEQLRAVTAALVTDTTLPPLIAIDQEGGVVSRLPWDDFASPRQLQALPVADTRTAFDRRAALVADIGANVNFGIVADVPADPASFISSRALGTDPESAGDRVAAAVEGEKGHVASTIKHFPGHGAAPGDSHHGIPSTAMTLEQWRASDAVPFVAGIDADGELLMFGHLAYTSVDAAPASLSARWHEIARDELGFDGVMVTDDLGMLSSSGVEAYRDPVANAVTALVAGNDLVLMVAGSTATTAPHMVDGIVRAVDDGTLPAARLQDAAERVMALRLALARD
ncbi:glycoside hydrolase family 3 N-terminal domain-containing protein [Microbacterium istanbulense]|uniref:Glycoside hydrolase family 3 N-terminal domain-containing protein n=1 Tax=Microbacterium istanbulense TaxID=3122049 RepID=A0ABU8LMQ8_9MICO